MNGADGKRLCCAEFALYGKNMPRSMAESSRMAMSVGPELSSASDFMGFLCGEVFCTAALSLGKLP